MTQRPLKIAFISPFLFRYARGIERYTFNLANAMAQRGLEVHLVTMAWQPPLEIEALDDRVRVFRLPASRYYAAQAMVPFYVWHFLRHRYDFVWIAFAGYGEAESLALARRQRFGVVFHYPLAQVPHRYREFNRYGLARRAAKIVSVSAYVAEGVKEFFSRESTVIHHGVNTDRFRPSAEGRRSVRAELGVGEAPVLLTAAALEERKGIQWVVRALPEILARFPGTIYLVVGGGSYRHALEELAAELGVQSNVCFLGEQRDVTPFYQAADVSLILARGEASSLAALESLACELPVVASRRPPFNELVTADYGILVNEEDSPAVADAVGRILGNVELGRTMGQCGRVQVSERFTWSSAAEQYVQVMESAVRLTGAGTGSPEVTPFSRVQLR